MCHVLVLSIFLILVQIIASVDVKYSVLIDAGSAGTRIFVYSYQNQNPLETLTEVTSKKHKTALSTLVDQSEKIQFLLQELLDDARKYVPPDQIPETKISLKATAGLRQLTQSDQDFLIEKVQLYLSTSGFKFIPSETRVINGKEEAFFGWMTVAIAFKIHQNLFSTPQSKYFGALDMGGASKQIAFLLRNGDCEINEDGKYCHELCQGDWKIKLFDSQESVELVSRSIPGLGIRSAMDEIVSFHEPGYIPTDGGNEDADNDEEEDDDEDLANVAELVNVDLLQSGLGMATHPCLAKGEFLPGSIHDYDYVLYGEGNFTKCLDLVRATFLPRIRSEINLECIHRNRPDVFVAMDSFPKMINMLGLLDDPHGISPQHVLENGLRICEISWSTLLHEVDPQLPTYHAQRACFASVYIYFLLIDVYGLSPHDIGAFIPMFEYNDHDLTWVLGAVGVSILPDNFVTSLS